MSFGGFGGDLTQRAQILLKVGVEGTTEIDKLKLAQADLIDHLKRARQDLDQGKISYRDYLGVTKQAESNVAALTRRLNDLEAAQKSTTSAIANASGLASAWGKVIAESGEKARA